jgi:hypothetical protein
MNPLWTIDELGAAAALTLSTDYEGPPNNRVRDVPDRRTIRYYTTLGLLDRPAEMRGRTALYNRRHLAQLVAIKRLQARGLSLAEIQQRLLGIPNAALNKLARLSAPVATPSSEPVVKPPPDRRSRAFWSAPPAPAVSDKTAIVYDRSPGEDVAFSRATPPLQGVPLDDEVLLLLSPTRTIDEDDVAALQTAAAPLLKLLHARRLLRPRRERGTS